MPPTETPMPPGVGMVIGVIYLLFIAGMLTFSILMLVVWWKAMKAHEKIAERLGEIAHKLPER